MRVHPRLSLVLFVAMVIAGFVSAAYVLVHQRLTRPGADTYEVTVDFAAADGVAPGLGQPVRVAGVQVGTIAAASRRGGRARVTLELERGKLAAVYHNARAALVPITPLKDMQVELNPGTPDAGRLPPGATVSVARTTTPAALADFLAALDADTRDYLTSLVASVDAGTRGRAAGVQRALRALGPTTRQVGDITAELDRRRSNLARLVHNLREVTRAAAHDQALQRVVSSGALVLEAVAHQQDSLDRALRRLPSTVRTADTTLSGAASLSRALPGTLAALTPPTRRLPAVLKTLQPFAAQTADALRHEVRPLVRAAQPLARALSPAMVDLRSLTPAITTTLRVANYALNELAFNPPGDDEGLLFWFPWWFHNYVSMFSAQDAHGSAARAMVLINCQQLTGLVGLGDILKTVLGTYSLCQGGN